MADIALELSAWVVDNYCSYDIAPIVELREGDRTEVGFELNLHAEPPWKGKLTPELRRRQRRFEKSSPSWSMCSFRRIRKKRIASQSNRS